MVLWYVLGVTHKSTSGGLAGDAGIRSGVQADAGGILLQQPGYGFAAGALKLALAGSVIASAIRRDRLHQA
ncbi:MAG: hypothetical protein WDO73_17215 [Ignavibacteriota bacterium]